MLGQPVNLVNQGDIKTMRYVAVAMFLFGGLVCASGVWITQTTPESKLAQGAVAVLFVVSGLLTMVLPAIRQLFVAFALWSILLISCLIAVTEQVGMAPIFFLWPVIYTAYFSSPKGTAIAFVLMAVTLAIALVLNANIELKADTWVGVTANVGLMAALISTMTQRENQLRESLAKAAGTDPLTGLMNRRSFDPQFDMILANAVRQKLPLSIVMFDIDHFKKVNDDYGHLVGDQALQGLAEVLRLSSRNGDLVTRLGGEEFAVVLLGADLEQAKAYTERVHESLNSIGVLARLNLKFSAGIATLDDPAESTEHMLQLADEALYAAKAGGRCRLAYWEDGIVVGPRFDETGLQIAT